MTTGPVGRCASGSAGGVQRRVDPQVGLGVGEVDQPGHPVAWGHDAEVGELVGFEDHPEEGGVGGRGVAGRAAGNERLIAEDR